MVCVCEVERECVCVCMCCLQGQGHREVGEGVRMSGGICVCVLKEIITLAINALALPPSLLAPPRYPLIGSFGGAREWSPAFRRGNF